MDASWASRVGEHPQALEDGVDRPVQAVDLGQRLRLPVRGVRLLGRLDASAQQLHVRPHDRERRPQGVGHDRDEVGAGLVDGPQRLQLRLGLLLQPLLLDEAGQQRRQGLQEAHVRGTEHAPLHGLDVEHADDLVVPDHGHRAHRGVPGLVDLADPGEPRDRR